MGKMIIWIPQSTRREGRVSVKGDHGASLSPCIACHAHKPLDVADKVPRELDFSKYGQRHVVLEVSVLIEGISATGTSHACFCLAAVQVMYIGVRFQGFARQDCTDNTIEGEFFKALWKTKLVGPT